MRYSAELAARATAWLARPLVERRNAAGLLELTSVWAAIQGLASATLCRQCQYSDRVHDLNAYLREFTRFTSSTTLMAEDTTAAPATYQFKPEYAGQTLTADDYGKAVNADNLTDEDAEHFIAKGFGHVFQKLGAAVEGLGAKLEGIGDGLASDSEDDEPTEREQELHQELEAANQKLADQTTSYNAEYARVTQSLTTLQASYDKLTADSAAQLADVQQQLTSAQAIIAALPASQLQKATDKASTATTPAESSTPASTSTASTADTDSTSSDGSATGSN